ncbi:MAG: hypothetical protein J6I80_04040 [Clostridia bacterium]|nr:hypothetical protein [Clostridia bacterium]
MTLESIKADIKRLFESDPNIHIDVALTHPRFELEGDPVVIKGVYPHVFRIEESSSSAQPKCHTLQYADVLIGRIKILELSK